MNSIRRYLGLLWLVIGPAAFFALIYAAFHNINSNQKGDISNPIPWLIILCIFAPISIGLAIFGWYAWKGEYEQ